MPEKLHIFCEPRPMRGVAISSNNFYFVIASTTIIVPCVAHFIVRFATQLVSKIPSFIIWYLSIFILLNPSGVLKTSFHFFSPGCTRSYPHSAPTGLFEKNYSRTIKSFHISQGCALQSPSLRGVWGGPAGYLSISGITRSSVPIMATRSPNLLPRAI